MAGEVIEDALSISTDDSAWTSVVMSAVERVVASAPVGVRRSNGLAHFVGVHGITLLGLHSIEALLDWLRRK